MLAQLISGRGVGLIVLVNDNKLLRLILTKQNFTSPLLVGHIFREKDTGLQVACADSRVAKYAAIPNRYFQSLCHVYHPRVKIG